MFTECCGDRPVSQYRRRELRDFYDLLRGLPALYSKSKEWVGLPLAEIVELFASPVWTGCSSETRRSSPGSKIIEDEKHWLPILGLFHGNRLQEFAQLRRADGRCRDGIWFLDINDDGTKQLKNEQSKRVSRYIRA